MIKIEDYIPEGKENAARASDIARWTGLDERSVREAISKSRRKIIILNFQDRNGYFIPTQDEMPLVADWLKQEESRLKKHALSLRAAREYVRGCNNDERVNGVL